MDVLCYPLEMVRIRLLAKHDVYRYSSVSDALIKILQQEGFRGLYKGAGSYFANLIGVYSVNLTLYELFIDSVIKQRGIKGYKEEETRFVIQASIASSIFTVLMMNSMEVIVVRR